MSIQIVQTAINLIANVMQRKWALSCIVWPCCELENLKI